VLRLLIWKSRRTLELKALPDPHMAWDYASSSALFLMLLLVSEALGLQYKDRITNNPIRFCSPKHCSVCQQAPLFFRQCNNYIETNLLNWFNLTRLFVLVWESTNFVSKCWKKVCFTQKHHSWTSRLFRSSRPINGLRWCRVLKPKIELVPT